MLKTHSDETIAFRDAMSRFAGAVHVVTTNGVAGRRGVTVSAACSVSDSPPILLVCLNRSNEQNKLFDENGVFALNTLGAAHQNLAGAFSGRDHLTQEERFSQASWEIKKTGAPVLVDALVSFECRLIDAKDMATHRVLFGEVVGIRTHDFHAPLVYHHRAYHSI